MGAEHTPLLVSNRGLSDFCAFGRPTSDEKIQMKWVHISSSAGTPREESGVLDIVTATVRGGIDYITRLNLAGQTGHRDMCWFEEVVKWRCAWTVTSFLSSSFHGGSHFIATVASMA